MEDVFQVNHRHVVFTINEGLWSVFLLHRKMLNEFMNEAVRIIKEQFEKKHKIKPTSGEEKTEKVTVEEFIARVQTR